MSKFREIGKNLVFSSLRSLGTYQKHRQKNADKAIVLTYHGLLPHIPDGIQRFESRNFVTTGQFDEQLQLLMKHYHPLKVEDFYEGNRQNLAGGFLVTFDDGFRNNLRYAMPILRKHGIQGCFFITTGLIGTKELLWTEKVTLLVARTRQKEITLTFDSKEKIALGSDSQREDASRRIRGYLKLQPPSKVKQVVDELQTQCDDVPSAVDHELSDRYQFMNWDEVKKMSENGMAIGSHTHTHPMLSTLNAEESLFELSESKRLLEKHTGQACLAISYPNGEKENYGETQKKQLAEIGYQCAFTQIPMFNDSTTGPYDLRRYNVTLDLPMPLFEARLSGYLNN